MSIPLVAIKVEHEAEIVWARRLAAVVHERIHQMFVSQSAMQREPEGAPVGVGEYSLTGFIGYGNRISR